MDFDNWLGKPYYSLNAYLKNTYGQKIYKIAVDAGLSCPNRDGTLDSRGCIFCSRGGSGDFAVSVSETKSEGAGGKENCRRNNGVDSVSKQIEAGIAKFNKSVGEKFIIYFQAFTNTYGDIEYLKRIWTEALSHKDVVGISIATRPDCLDNDVVNLLRELKKSKTDKFIWIELGLQTIHKKTAEYIRRGYPLSVYDEAVDKLNDLGIPYITHIILGLPFETEEMMLDTVRYVNNRKSFGIKLQLLHVLEETDLADEYQKGIFEVLDMDRYISLVIECLENTSPEIVIHRVTGDGPKKILIAPTWSGNKKNVLNTLHKRMRELGAYQGKSDKNSKQ